jgi:hypothetical protein
VKLNNFTVYSTRDLKKIFTRIAREELNPNQAKHVQFKIIYSKKGRISGCAWVGSWDGTIRLPKPPYTLNHATLAMVIAHEMAHLRGVEHGAAMHCGRYSWQWGDYKTFYAWANEYPISVREPKPKAVVAPVDANDAGKERSQTEAHSKV